MNTKKLKGCQFVIFRAQNDEYYEADNHFVIVSADSRNGMYPEMQIGEFALVTADVTLYEGGEAGFRGNKTINKLISYEIISSDVALERCDITEVGEAYFSYDREMLMYHSEDNVYYVLRYNGKYLVYLNGALLGEYEIPDESDQLAAFLEDITVPYKE